MHQMIKTQRTELNKVNNLSSIIMFMTLEEANPNVISAKQTSNACYGLVFQMLNAGLV